MAGINVEELLDSTLKKDPPPESRSLAFKERHDREGDHGRRERYREFRERDHVIRDRSHDRPHIHRNNKARSQSRDRDRHYSRDHRN